MLNLDHLKPGVTFATSVYEKDWKEVLSTGRLEQMIASANYPFVHKLLVVNHIEPDAELLATIDQLKRSGVIDQIEFSHMWRNRVLDYFDISQHNLMPGYNYLIQNLTALYFCPSEYLLWFTCDSMVENDIDWIDPAIAMMQKHERVVVANPTWNMEFNQAKAESSGEIDDFYYGYGFSDQCCLLPIKRYHQAIYNSDHRRSKRYPHYAGYSFERRIDSWMQNNSLLRITHKKASYRHQNFT